MKVNTARVYVSGNGTVKAKTMNAPQANIRPNRVRKTVPNTLKGIKKRIRPIRSTDPKKYATTGPREISGDTIWFSSK